jgi:nicotinate dehydrogenase subunit A
VVATLRLNGAVREVAADPDTPLLYVLRNDFGLMGARFGCGVGLCGACFVHLDGVPVPSCDTPLWSVEGKTVVTVEGLGAAPHPVQQMLLAEQAAQCGYCVTGIVMTAVALLERELAPDEATVAGALDRHLCRCGAQRRMVRAVLRAGQQKAAQEKAAQEKAGQEKAGQEKAGQEKAGQEKAGHEKAGQEEAGREKAARESG